MEVKEIVLHDKITKIGNGAFANIWDDVDIHLPQEEREHLTLILPDFLKEIGDFAFGFSGLGAVVVSDSVEKVGEYAFENLMGYNGGVFCESASKPDGWHKYWCGFFMDNAQVYRKGSWEYVNGKPVAETTPE